MIAIIDYDAGNIKSVEKALLFLGEEVIVTRDKDLIMKADKAILPGVGSFGDAMGKLREYDLIDTIKDYVKSGKPFLGICLGLQLLFEESEETPGVEGLGILKGKIIRFSENKGFKIPQIGWNSIKIRPDSKLFAGISDESYVYFVHSYYLQAEDESVVATKTEYADVFHSAVEKDNVFACQFHPEKSSDVGLKILSNFAKM